MLQSFINLVVQYKSDNENGRDNLQTYFNKHLYVMRTYAHTHTYTHTCIHAGRYYAHTQTTIAPIALGHPWHYLNAFNIVA